MESSAEFRLHMPNDAGRAPEATETAAAKSRVWAIVKRRIELELLTRPAHTTTVAPSADLSLG